MVIHEARPRLPEAREANGRTTASSACFLHIHAQHSPLDVSGAGCPIGELSLLTNNIESQSYKGSQRPKGWD